MIFNLRFRSAARIGYRRLVPRVPTSQHASATTEQIARVGGGPGEYVDRNCTSWFVTPGVPMLPKFARDTGGEVWRASGHTSVMIEKFTGVRGMGLSEFLDLNHTSKSTILVSLMIPKFARDASGEAWRTSESGH